MLVLILVLAMHASVYGQALVFHYVCMKPYHLYIVYNLYKIVVLLVL